MEPALTIWNRRRDEPWLTRVESVALAERVEQRRRLLEPGVRVLNVEVDAIDFLAGFFATITHEHAVELFLGSPRWSAVDLKRCRELARPHVVWGPEGRAERPTVSAAAGNFGGLIMIPSGGTTGGLRFAAHTWESLSTAAYGLQQWLGGGPIDSVCFLPLHHVSGLMQVVRSFVTGGVLQLADWGEIESGRFPVAADAAVTSLVPTQLERLRSVRGAVDWLRGFRCVFLGGARVSDALLNWARKEKLPLAPSYGMTETAAQVATMRPEEFLSGQPISAKPLPHAEIDVFDENGRPQAKGAAGRIVIRSAALFCGYYPNLTSRTMIFATSDLGLVDDDGRVVVLGRLDTIINTGGEKVQPEEVEAALMATGLIRMAAVVGMPNKSWGEIVAAAVVPMATIDEARLADALRDVLASYKIPKRWRFVEMLPRNAAGKVDLEAVRRLLSETTHGESSRQTPVD